MKLSILRLLLIFFSVYLLTQFSWQYISGWWLLLSILMRTPHECRLQQRRETCSTRSAFPSSNTESTVYERELWTQRMVHTTIHCFTPVTLLKTSTMNFIWVYGKRKPNYSKHLEVLTLISFSYDTVIDFEVHCRICNFFDGRDIYIHGRPGQNCSTQPTTCLASSTATTTLQWFCAPWKKWSSAAIQITL